MLTHFDFADLRLFICIAEENSLTRGAERVHMSLPAASTRIKNLEELLGAKLLYRASNGVTLTPPGTGAAATCARRAAADGASVRRLAGIFAQGVKGHVRLFANTTAITEFLPGVLSRFPCHASQCECRSARAAEPDASFARSPTALRTSASSRAMSAPKGSRCCPIGRTGSSSFVRAGTRSASSTRSSFEETLEFDHVCLPEASAIHSFLVEAADRVNRRLKLRIQVGNFEAMCRLVQANVGIGILPNPRRVDRRRRATSISSVSPTNGRCAISRSACAASICCRASRAIWSR